MKDAKEGPRPPVNDLTSKEVLDFGKAVGKDSIKQALVWTIASAIANGLKNVISQVTKPKG
jgi:hypothetical protein